MMKINAQPINFKFNEYMSKGYELLKNNFGNILGATILCILMSIIPFLGLVAVGNFYKYLRKLNKGQNASAGEIFNFDDFMPYFILQLIIIAALVVVYIPFVLLGGVLGLVGGSDSGSAISVLFFPYFILVYVAVFYFVLKGFYIPALISLKGVRDIKTAWFASKIMTKDNLLNIFLFSLVIGILSQIGILACGIGILVTMPYMYTSNFFAFEDAISQIEHDEISEIGIKENY